MSDGWRDVAACAETDPELFFPEKGGDSARWAKSVCREVCQVREACLQDALDTADVEWGVRGGLSPRERRALLDRPRRLGVQKVSRVRVAELTLAGLSAVEIAVQLRTTGRTVARVRAELRDAA